MSARQHVVDGWIPVRRADGDVDIVTESPLDAEALDRIRASLGVVPSRQVRAIEVPRKQLDATIARECRAELVHDISESLADEQPERSARAGLTRWQLSVPPLLIALLVAGAIWQPRVTLIAFFGIASLSLGVVMAFRLFFTVLGVAKRLWRRHRRDRAARRSLTGPLATSLVGETADELPLYTVLVPVFHEANIVARLIDNLERMDYPRDRLEVLVLLEEDDTETIAAALSAEPPPYMRVVVVPRGTPQTKPRACNYGLVFARGDYLVIYDAEDRPEPDQLRRVVADFETARREGKGRPLAVVQCCLSYFNASYNVLTRLFAIEYSVLFDALLPGIDGTGLPIPLGGTSNHFDTEMLRRIGGWDPYNVTEDADLGIRAAALGYRVGTNTSTTWEEACSRSGAFVKQRTRWIKGYLVTSAVNLRHPVAFTRAAGIRGLVCLVALVLGTPAAFLAYPVMLAASLFALTGERWEALALPQWVADVGLTVTILSTGLTILTSGLVALRRYGWRVAGFALFSPVYWVLHAIAAWRAAWQTMFTPHHWEKTPHGLSDDLEVEALLG